MKALVATLTTIGLLAWGASGLVAQSGNDLFQQALVKERTAGDIAGAIALYQTIVQKHASDRALVARSLVQMGGCYEKLGGAEASRTYERVAREFADQTASATTAQARLAALQATAATQVGPVTRRIWDNVNQWSYNVRAPSADGRYLSFTGDHGDLGVLDLKEGTSRYLTNEGAKTGGAEEAASSLVSRDGRHVVYGWHPTDNVDQLRVLPLTGLPSQPRILHRDLNKDENTYPVGWTPDGRRVLVLRELSDFTGQIAFIAIADGSLQVLKSFQWWTRVGDVSLSPDGRLIAYDMATETGGRAHDIFLLAADGSGETAVVQSPAEDRQPVWSPDGREILFVSNRTEGASLWRVAIVAGRPAGQPVLVRSEMNGRLLGVTQTGALHYVAGGPTTNIYSVEIDANLKVTGTPVRATERFVNGNSDPAWSGDGQFLAYRRGSSIVIRSGGEERVVVTELKAAQLAGWFPGGQSLLVLSSDSEQLRTGFHRLDIASGRAEPLMSVKQREGRLSPLRPVVSPGGGAIYYRDESVSPSALRQFFLDSRQDVEVRARFSGPLAVSPDGSYLAFIEDGWLTVLPSGGGEARRIDGPGRASPELAWTADSRFLLYLDRADNRRELFRVPVGGGERQPVGLVGPPVSLSAHPDGRRLTYRKTDGRPFELWALENFLPKPRAAK